MKKDNKQKKETFHQKFENCEKERQEFLAGWQRAKADFLNYKKEEEERVGGLAEMIKTGMILDALRIFDNLEMARRHTPKDIEDSEWVKGVLQVISQFKDLLKEQGVEEIKAIGESFDPNLHEAIEKVENKNLKTGIITKVIQKGYKLNGCVLRPARVRVVR